MMFSVFLHPVFLFSHSTMSNYLDQKLRARVAGWVEQRLSPRLHQAGSAEPLLRASSVVCRAGPRPSAVLGQQDRVLLWFSIQMTKTQQLEQ